LSVLAPPTLSPYTLSLHDALPISCPSPEYHAGRSRLMKAEPVSCRTRIRAPEWGRRQKSWSGDTGCPPRSAHAAETLRHEPRKLCDAGPVENPWKGIRASPDETTHRLYGAPAGRTLAAAADSDQSRPPVR